MEKPCTTCKKTKQLGEFNRNRNFKDGHDYVCKACARAKQSKYRKENRAVFTEAQRKWRGKNPDAAKENSAAYSRMARQESLASATNKGRPWTEADDQIVMRRDLPLLEISQIVGRTYASCSMRRSILNETEVRRQIIESVQRRIAGEAA